MFRVVYCFTRFKILADKPFIDLDGVYGITNYRTFRSRYSPIYIPNVFKIAKDKLVITMASDLEIIPTQDTLLAWDLTPKPLKEYVLTC